MTEDTKSMVHSVLLAFADGDPNDPLRNLAAEDEAIRDALDPLLREGKLADRSTLWHASADRIAKAFRRERAARCRLFHFGGHASATTVMLTNVEGGPAAADARALAQFLGQQQGLELVVLNGCGTKPQIDALHAAGIKAVIATTCAIFDDVAADFAAQLYAGLVHRPLRQAFEEAVAVVGMKPGKDGSTPREIVKAGSSSSPGWEYSTPWVLSPSGDPEVDGWWLVPKPRYDVRDVVEVLSRLFPSEPEAKLVTGRAGVPPALNPPFSPNALFYWTTVVDAAVGGRIQGGIEALLREAAALFPYSEDLRRLRGLGV